MLKYKAQCPICQGDITVDVMRGKITAPCGHVLRVRAKQNGWISCIFAFFTAVTVTNFTHVYFVKMSIGSVLELIVALAIVMIVVSILYAIFGFDNVYRVEERKK